MIVNFELGKLREVLALFCDLTRITITLFDVDLNPVLDVGAWKNYCLAIGENEARLENCRRCNLMHAELVSSSKEPLVYTCHAGIAEAVMPIFIDDALAAYLMIGKFRDTEGEFTSREKVIQAAERYGLDKDRMLAAWEELPEFDKGSINSAILLLKAIMHLINNERLIRTTQNILCQQIEDYVGKHIGEKITVENICKELHIARHTLYETFRRNFKKSPHDYVDQVRLQKAQQLLVKTDMPIQEISELLGFPKPSHFSHFFKDKMGMGVTPLQYRKQN